MHFARSVKQLKIDKVDATIVVFESVLGPLKYMFATYSQGNDDSIEFTEAKEFAGI